MKLSVTILLLGCIWGVSSGQAYQLSSPGRINEWRIDVSNKIYLSVYHRGQAVIENASVSMTIDGQKLGDKAKVASMEKRSFSKELQPVVAYKRSLVPDRYNEIELVFKEGFTLLLRCYDDGLAYRFTTNLKGEVTVEAEEVNFLFVQDYSGEFPYEDSFYSHSERQYLHRRISDFATDTICSLPAMVNLEKGRRAVITEADLHDYPGLYLRGSGQPGLLQGSFPPYVTKTAKTSDRDVVPVERANYLAKTQGKRNFPWRVIVLSDQDTELLENDLVFRLSQPSKLSNTDWIKPGKVAWDWYNYNNSYGVDFRAGINTETYLYNIDFAAKYGLSYIILDEGWYDINTSNLLQPISAIDLQRIIAYGQEKGVGIILWVTWKALEDQLTPALEKFQSWGVKGIKVDFMQRDDQWMVNWYWKVAEAAAKHQLLVNFHGSYKPAGLHRTYPNVLTREGVRGLEWSKWSEDANPEHNLQIPFLRMLAGPMDYTPGAMRNAQAAAFAQLFTRPMSLGTRCHQLAMYVAYESPLQMLADNPSDYLRNDECMEWLSAVPTTWDESKALAAQYSDYLVMARRKGRNWYLAAMTDWTARELTIDLSFLPPGEYQALIFRDGINADRMAEDYKKVDTTLVAGQQLKVQLAPGGGWVAKLQQKP